jgi:hypothetical protein
MQMFPEGLNTAVTTLVLVGTKVDTVAWLGGHPCEVTTQL